jgi:HSP20 family molecular chaperone IbpA
MHRHVRILTCSLPAASPALGAVFADLVGEMSSERQYGWMWVEACEVLDRAERLQRQFLRYMGPGTDVAVWEPPVDIQETADGLILLFVLPGVVPDQINLSLEPTELTLSAVRPLKLAHPDAVIRRLEIPHGRFFRRIPLAGVPLELTSSRYENGCLEVRLTPIKQR